MDRDNSDKNECQGQEVHGQGGEGQSWWGPAALWGAGDTGECEPPTPGQSSASPVPLMLCTSMSLHPPFSWNNDWVWRSQGITAPAFPMGALQGPAQAFRPARDGAKDWQVPHTDLPAAPQQSTGHQQHQSLSLTPGKAWTQLCPRRFHLPQQSPGEAPMRPGYGTQPPSEQQVPGPSPKATFPRCPGPVCLGQTQLTLVGTSYHPRITWGFPCHGHDPFHHLSCDSPDLAPARTRDASVHIPLRQQCGGTILALFQPRLVLALQDQISPSSGAAPALLLPQFLPIIV